MFKKVGIIVNRLAGSGIDSKKIQIINSVLKKLRPKTVFGSRMLGLEYLGSNFAKKEIQIQLDGSRNDTLKLTNELDEIVDVIVVFGGDGTFSDVASCKPRNPLLCIGIGTTNVSPVITKPNFDPKKLGISVPRALEAEFRDDYRIAFNDVVVGSTILATINGKRVQVDAKEYLSGKKIISKPKKFYASIKIGNKTIFGRFGNIFISPVNKNFVGKGIAGGVSLSAFLNFKGVVACINVGIIVSTISKSELKMIEPIITKTISFDDETVHIETGGMISCDGNPVSDGEVKVRIIDGVIRVLKEKSLSN